MTKETEIRLWKVDLRKIDSAKSSWIEFEFAWINSVVNRQRRRPPRSGILKQRQDASLILNVFLEDANGLFPHVRQHGRGDISKPFRVWLQAWPRLQAWQW